MHNNTEWNTMMLRLTLLLLALTAMATASTNSIGSLCETEKRVIIFADEGSQCLQQPTEDCYKRVAGAAYAYLHGDIEPEGDGRRLFGCSSCRACWGKMMCAYYGYCRRRDLQGFSFEQDLFDEQAEQQENLPMLRGGNRLLTGSTQTDTLDIGKLGDFGLVILNGKDEAKIEKSPTGIIGDMYVNGQTAKESYSGEIYFEGTIYTSNDNLREWEDILEDNPTTANAVYNQDLLQDELENDFDLTIKEIKDMSATPGFAYVHAAYGLDMVNFENGRAEVVVMDIRAGFVIDKPVHIVADSYDLVILRWDEDGDMTNGFDGVVEFIGDGGIYPAGQLTPDRLVHVAGQMIGKAGSSSTGSGSRRRNLVSVNGYEFPNNGFFIGNWFHKPKGDDEDKELKLDGGTIIGGLYTKGKKVELKEVNIINVDLSISWLPDAPDHDVFGDSYEEFLDEACWNTIGITTDVQFDIGLMEYLGEEFGPDVELMQFEVQCKKEECVEDVTR